LCTYVKVLGVYVGRGGNGRQSRVRIAVTRRVEQGPIPLLLRQLLDPLRRLFPGFRFGRFGHLLLGSFCRFLRCDHFLAEDLFEKI
jgi:hypothetical protein